MPVVRDIQIKIPREEVLRLLRHNEKTTVLDKRIEGLINDLIKEGKKLAIPKAVYRNFWVKGTRERAIILEGSDFDLLGKNITHHLWNAEGVTLFTATIGPKLENRIEVLTKKTNMANAVILDAVGSVAIESAVAYINELVNEKARQSGYKTVKRFSPGYGDWHLKEQKGLLKLLNARAIGISLSKGYEMQPQKSVSGVIGWIK